MPSFARSVALLFALFNAAAYAVHTVEIQGQDFIDSVTKKRLVVVGVDYQPGGQSGYKPDSGQDALSNGTVCLRDAALLQRLGVNTIRVYNVAPQINHDECASIFNAVGIYMMIDVNSPLGGESINRADPASSYHAGYLSRIFGIVENFKNYPNTLAFFAANEVMNDLSTVKKPPPYIRAVQRDLKNYIAKHASRTIPVGYSAADVREVLQDSWAYLQCNIGGKTDLSRSDFFGLNSYSWCGGDATFQTAGYDTLVNMFENSSIPVFFSEYGCNKVQPRVFNEVGALYGPQMTALSGGLVYEYSQEEADFGLVQINDNTTVSLLIDYDNLQKAYNKLNMTLIQDATPSQTQAAAPACSSDLISNSGFTKSFDIPKIPDGGDDLINSGVPNALQGKLVQVKETNVPMAVYGSTGGQIQNLAIKPLPNDATNTPTNETTSTTSKPKGAASRLSGASAGLVAALAVVLTLL